MPNSSIHNPTAPPVAFEIAEPKCEFAGKSTNPNIVYIPNDSITPIVDLSDINVFPERGGTHRIGVRAGFVGDLEDIKQLGIDNIRNVSQNVLSFSMSLELLPMLCQIEGLQYIRPQPKAGLELNYSTDDINCVYSVIQNNLGVSGKNVIWGILDTGIDWLHEDFIDSNGNTRIRYFWDQVEQTRIPLV
jgi:hypothetical protein